MRGPSTPSTAAMRGLRHVRLGHMGEAVAEVLDGLEAGDRVVVYPGETLEDGNRVTPSDPR